MKIDTEALRRQMGVKFLNGRQLAQQVGFSTTAMYKILRGERQPKPENLRKICEALECGPEEIVKEW